MTDIAIPTQGSVETYQASSVDRLQRWAKQAVAVRQMADSICSTSFAPQAYRGKPDEATAAILAGAELGLDPMASLRAFDNIQGTPAPKAMTLRAVAQAAGHEVRVVEATAERAVVEGRRKGESSWSQSVWDIPRAQAMGLTGKAQWKQQPAAMLVARATSEVCRWIASDAIMGMPYSAEEISDHTGAEARPVTRSVSAGDFVTKAVEHDYTNGGRINAIPETTVEAITTDEALARIKVAEDQADLDEVRRLVTEAGLQDERIVAAWKLKHFEIGGGPDA